ncbi:MAG TPA: energy transducer TonB, partial [Terriglobales bacterium]|nr:energy transducer TonB [Terriglobales bacterium]
MRGALLTAAVVVLALLAGGQEGAAPPPAAAIPTPAQLDQAIEDFARGIPAGITADRYATFAVEMPKDEAEYEALNKHALLVVAALAKDASELPLQRVYLEQEKGTQLLPLLASVASEMPADSPAAKLMGTHRVDAYYLIPLSAWRQPGTLLADFAAHRQEFVLGKFPQQIQKDFVRNDQSFNPAPGETIGVGDLRRILERAAPDKKWGEAELAPIACLMVAPDDPYPLCARVGPPPGTPPMGKRIRVSPQVLSRGQTKMVPPMAPVELLKQHPGGVSVRVIVGEDGKVKDVQVVSGDATVAAIVVAAVRQWKFRPFVLNGKPFEVESQLTFDMGTKPG